MERTVVMLNLVKMQESNCVPVAVFEEAQRAIFHLLPAKSREHYEKVFAEFNEWSEKRRVMTINEEVMLSYFFNLKKKYEVSSLWSKVNRGGYKPKKAAILERAHIEEFFTRVCDKEYLRIKAKGEEDAQKQDGKRRWRRTCSSYKLENGKRKQRIGRSGDV
ncbi:hypothetical protein NQ315_011043 [Exocentrus adspersus]|uniref:Uncharacterized protein n=1 Tax=Exocentrus adspersus TaxID=1586481 RepID=A0AAV8VEW5_9CUCU|nr:hypothetical protein NQ315_011043 [Exocentrus adspersus]